MAQFDHQPTLTDGLVRLRPMQAADWDAVYGVARDPAIWAVHPEPDRWREDVFRDIFVQRLRQGGALVIEDARTGAAIGSSSYDLARADAGEIEIGWTFLARERWGGATNAAVKRLMIDHALTYYDRVIFLIGADNIRSRRALEKIGGVLTARVLDIPIKGRLAPYVVYAIDRAMFASGPLAR